ncbi:hypothetical protein BA895_22305 [Humibacillus sp. DSM 29435]|uniref:hypothetical protein n=1 Tax=Humibacillus sp. DSM 29435 TaxID=1869167 RepID=UPI000872F26F|nr:hypothetical protein [Humibacillus sp. DSM 29435]OFE15592.1 hypothetical protein BA895_22305 [Humibacillus sp. DSM 29435]
MLAIVFRFPGLASEASVIAYWTMHEKTTQTVIALVALGYPGLVLFLVGLPYAWSMTSSAWARAATAMGCMFITSLVVALGLASAAGQLIQASDSNAHLGYGLHVAAFVLAAPAAGLGTGFFLAVIVSTFSVAPRWLRVPAGIGALCNAGALGGHFDLAGPLNSGNGLLGGIALPLASLMVYVACVCVERLVGHGRPRPTAADST